jgi:3-methyladenine DNA glycosylase AlkD
MTLAAELERTVKPHGTAERATQEKRYLKSDYQHFGVVVPVMRRLVKPFGTRIENHAQLKATIDALWARGVYELRFAATVLLAQRVELLAARDLPWLQKLVREARTWALVDNLAPFVVGKIAEGDALDRWATHDDFWVRRAALLALLLPLRAGGGDWARFTRYADSMLEEREFFIRKAIGWILRETSRKTPDRVYAWLLPRAHRAAGLTVREATKYLTATQRAAIGARFTGRARGAGSPPDPSPRARPDAVSPAARSPDTRRRRHRPADRVPSGTRRA